MFITMSATITTTAPPTDPRLQEQPLPSTTSVPMVVTQQAYTADTSHGSVGPVIGFLAMIAILGVIAGMIGRLCSGRSIMGYGHFDVESWIETKCASCLDGYVEPPRRRPPPPQPAVAQPSVPTPAPTRAEEVKTASGAREKEVEDSSSEDCLDDDGDDGSEHFHTHDNDGYTHGAS